MKKVRAGDEKDNEDKFEDGCSSDDDDVRKFKFNPIPDFSGDEDEHDDEEHEGEGSENDDIPDSNRSRGPSIGSKQNKKRKRGGRIVIKYNKLGVPTGKSSNDLCTHLGVLARTSVPITYTDWRRVPSEVKDRLMASVNVKQTFPQFP